MVPTCVTLGVSAWFGFFFWGGSVSAPFSVCAFRPTLDISGKSTVRHSSGTGFAMFGPAARLAGFLCLFSFFNAVSCVPPAPVLFETKTTSWKRWPSPFLGRFFSPLYLLHVVVVVVVSFFFLLFFSCRRVPRDVFPPSWTEPAARLILVCSFLFCWCSLPPSAFRADGA